MVTDPAVQDITWCSEVAWKPLGFVFLGLRTNFLNILSAAPAFRAAAWTCLTYFGGGALLVLHISSPTGEFSADKHVSLSNENRVSVQ